MSWRGHAGAARRGVSPFSAHVTLYDVLAALLLPLDSIFMWDYDEVKEDIARLHD
jgi:hypothetical protein